jgi:hypothetical protein
MGWSKGPINPKKKKKKKNSNTDAAVHFESTNIREYDKTMT